MRFIVCILQRQLGIVCVFLYGELLYVSEHNNDNGTCRYVWFVRGRLRHGDALRGSESRSRTPAETFSHERTHGGAVVRRTRHTASPLLQVSIRLFFLVE